MGEQRQPSDPLEQWRAMAAAQAKGRSADPMAIVVLALAGLGIVLAIVAAGVLVTNFPSRHAPTAIAAASSELTAAPTATPTPQPTPTASPRPLSTATLPASVVDRFLARIIAEDFQFEATVTGTVEDGFQGLNAVWGTASMKGYDSAWHLQVAGDGWIPWGLNYSVFLGDTWYTESGGRVGCPDGTCASVREKGGADSYLAWFRSIRALNDGGVVAWHGQEVHVLRAGYVEVGRGSLLDLADTSTFSDLQLGLVFLVRSDGEPAGMSLDATWYTRGARGDCELVLDYTFDKLSGVTIEAPV